MILLYTDFGWAGPYVGQMKAVLAAAAPGVPLVDLMHDAPAFAPGPAGRLLAALLRDLPQPSPAGDFAPGPDVPPDAGQDGGPDGRPDGGPVGGQDGGPDVVLGVVDPGVGTARRPVAVSAGGRVFVGPDNGLFAPAVEAAGGPVAARAWVLTLAPARLSASFHGRDLFAPAAAAIALGRPVPGEAVDPASLVGLAPQAAGSTAAGSVAESVAGSAAGSATGSAVGSVAGSVAGQAGAAASATGGRGAPAAPTVLAVDGYGNAMLDLEAADLPADTALEVGGRRLARARTFGEVPEGTAFWYENSLGLVEIAVNRGSAAEALGLAPGAVVRPTRRG